MFFKIYTDRVAIQGSVEPHCMYIHLGDTLGDVNL